jgi:hypothetical protein
VRRVVAVDLRIAIEMPYVGNDNRALGDEVAWHNTLVTPTRRERGVTFVPVILDETMWEAGGGDGMPAQGLLDHCADVWRWSKSEGGRCRRRCRVRLGRVSGHRGMPPAQDALRCVEAGGTAAAAVGHGSEDAYVWAGTHNIVAASHAFSRRDSPCRSASLISVAEKLGRSSPLACFQRKRRHD